MKFNKIILIIILLSFLSFGSGDAGKSTIMIPLEPLSIADYAGLSLSQSSLPYSTTGSIKENGDDYWDDNEVDIIRYEIPAGETFSIELITSSDAELWVFYGDFDGYKDIEDALDDIANSGDSSRLLEWDYTVDGYASFSYTPSSKTNRNIAIFSYNTFNPSSMSYTLYSSIELYSGSSGSSSFVTIAIIAGVILIVFLIYRSSKKSKKPQYEQQYAQQPGYQQPSYQQPSYQQQTPRASTYESMSSQPSKPDYQQQTTTKYCENCGSENEGAAMYCTTCGNRVS